MSAYRQIKKLLFRLDPEEAHHLVFRNARRLQGAVLPLPLLSKCLSVRDRRLESSVFDLRFPNPVGLAAGFDKNAELVDFLSAMGFGFIEVGSVTNQAREGNPRPRLFRLEQDEALINRMGLNNKGPEAVADNLSRHRQAVPLGINIAKSNVPTIVGQQAIEDMVSCYRKIAKYGDYVVLNLSCPNTSDGKTFEAPESFSALLQAIADERRSVQSTVPLLVKFSSDLPLGDLERLLEISESYAIDGYIFVNTSTSRAGLSTTSERITEIGAGGLSGKPLQAKSLERVRAAYRILGGKKPIIGLGGVDSAEFAYALIKAGASLIQLYTGLIYQGPGVCKSINSGLLQLLERDGYSSIADAVGKESAQPSKQTEQAALTA